MVRVVGLLIALFVVAGCASPRTPPDSQAHADQPSSQPVSRPAAPSSFAERPDLGTEAICSVSGDRFSVASDTPYSEYQGRFYVFCCPECKEEFDADPAKFTGP